MLGKVLGKGLVQIRRSVSPLVFCLGLLFLMNTGCSDDGAVPDPGSRGSQASESKPPQPPTPQTVTIPEPPASPSATDGAVVVRSREELIKAGRSAYNANCIACHGPDATKDGALGPAVSGSSLALLESRVLRSEYPEGYVPKRTTRVMVALPHLEPRIAELAAYLNSLE